MKFVKRQLNEMESLSAYSSCTCSCSSCPSCGCHCPGNYDPKESGYSVTSYEGLGGSYSPKLSDYNTRGIK